MANADEFALIEWHDGRLESLVIAPQRAVLNFKKCFVYRRKGVEEYDVESCGGELSLEGVRELKLVGVPDSEASVSDCTISSEGSTPTPELLLAGIGPGALELVMTNGSELAAEFDEAVLHLRPPFTLVDHWHGPLLPEDT